MVFEVRDFDLVGRPALARARSYDGALRAVRRLHGAFLEELDATVGARPGCPSGWRW